MKNQLLLKVIGAVLLLGLLAACAPPATPPPEATAPPTEPTTPPAEPTTPPPEATPPPEVGGPVRDRDTLVVAVQKAAPTLDPTVDSVDYFPILQIFDWLVGTDAEVNYIPGLATEWEMVDEYTWEFKLREGVKFHNGEDFTCEDVKFTVDRILDPATESRQLPVYLSQVEDSECVDDFTFRVTTNMVAPAFLARFSFLRVVPADTFQEMGAEAFAVNPVGSGPYKLLEWVQGSHATLEANEDYWGGAPPIKHLEILDVTEPSTRVSMLLAGDVDWIYEVPASDVARIEADPNLEVNWKASIHNMFVGMNSFNEPFDDVRVRQAMNYAVNWDEIIETLQEGFGTRNAATIGPFVFGYDPDLEPYPYDPDEARRLLAEAGYADGFEAGFDCPNGRYPKDKEMCEAIAGYLSEVGVQVEMINNDWSTYWSRFLGQEMPGFYYLGCVSIGGADFDLCNRLHFHSQVRGLYYNTPEVDALLDEEAEILDPVERERKCQELLGVLQEEAPWIFGYDAPTIVANRIGLSQEVRPDLTAKFATFSWE